MIFREVTDSRYVAANIAGGSYLDTLECGHEVAIKASKHGNALKRRCRQCEDLEAGAFVIIGNQIEKWNPETCMPHWVPKEDGDGHTPTEDL